MAHVARRLRRVARSAAPDDDQLASVGRPLKTGHAVQQVRDPARLAAAEREQPDLRARRIAGGIAGHGPGGQKRDRLAVRPPPRAVGRLWRGRQRRRLVRAVGGHRPDGGSAPVLFLIDRRHDVGDRGAVGREVRIAERLEGEVVLGRHPARLRHRGCAEREQRKREAQIDAFFHKPLALSPKPSSPTRACASSLPPPAPPRPAFSSRRSCRGSCAALPSG